MTDVLVLHSGDTKMIYFSKDQSSTAQNYTLETQMMNSAVVTLFKFPTPRSIPLVFRPPLTMVTQHCVTKNSACTQFSEKKRFVALNDLCSVLPQANDAVLTKALMSGLNDSDPQIVENHKRVIAAEFKPLSIKKWLKM